MGITLEHLQGCLYFPECHLSGGIMGEREKVTWEELAWSNQIQQEALIRILIGKGIITQEELLAEVKQVQQTYMEQKT